MEELDDAVRRSGASAYLLYASSADADMRYLTHFVTSDPVPYIRKGGHRGLIVVSQMEYARAVQESSAEAITRADAGYLEHLEKEGDPWKALARTIAGLVEGDVLVPPTFPFALAQALQASRRVLLDSGTVASMRAKKSGEEIARITAAQRAAESAIDYAVSLIRASVPRRGILHRDGAPLTSERVRHAMHRLLLEQGYQASETIVSCGRDTAIPHVRGSGPLREGEPIVIDVFPRSEETGYHADMTRTVVKGEADPRIREMYAAVREAGALAAARAGPGVSGADLHQQVVDLFRERGFESGTEGFIHNLGHGVGLEVHELPIVGPRGQPLSSGNVITLEPALYYRDAGGVRLENLGVVVQDGFDCLTRYPMELEL
ncbi:MAG: Xaa-Pro peptidase family protein [Methanomicrobiales archaeon]|nr:Xaa-Pro peptidase family protein [Methanomicrobiales archaeon]MDI6875977.1 Xaa-Pro peptidase family protein [Methanomicrobiales archaeon]